MNHFPIEFPRRAAMALFGGAVAAGALGAAPSARAAQGSRMQQVIPAPEFGGSFINEGTLRAYGVEFGYRFGR